MFEEVMLIFSTILIVLISIFFAYTYYKKIMFAQKEYEVAKEFITGIVFTFKKRLETSNSKMNSILADIENLYSMIEKREKQSNNLHNKLIYLTTKLFHSSFISKKIVDNIISINNNINNLKITDTELLQKIEMIHNEYKDRLQSSQPSKNIQRIQQKSLFKLTKTERDILQILIATGAKTAPEIEKKIGKTREHTSRLMKKLWQNGYIERETQVSPFIYRPTKELAKQINTQ